MTQTDRTNDSSPSPCGEGWGGVEVIKPYSATGEKSEQVEQMFDNIAPKYDLLNHLLSLGIDKSWRRKAVDSLRPFAPQTILDVATGTGDFALLVADRVQPVSIIGCDLSEGMMQVAREKVKKREGTTITFQREDCLSLSFPDDSFDAVTVAYGVRNFQDLEAGLREMHRVLKPGGHLLIVELATPPRFPMKQLFWVYSRLIMPFVGKIVSGDSRAYTYLPSSMTAFPQAEVLAPILKDKIGFSKVEWKRFTFGISTMYLAEK